MKVCLRIMTSLATAALLAACGHEWDHEASSSLDSWFRPPANWNGFRQAPRLPDSDILEVAPGGAAAAVEQLRNAACLEISAEQAAEIAGRKTLSAGDGKWYLVRGVCLNRGTGKFTVVEVGSELLVEHGSLGHSAVPMKRQPLIVRLQRKPETVYVSCSMDE